MAAGGGELSTEFTMGRPPGTRGTSLPYYCHTFATPLPYPCHTLVRSCLSSGLAALSSQSVGAVGRAGGAGKHGVTVIMVAVAHQSSGLKRGDLVLRLAGVDISEVCCASSPSSSSSSSSSSFPLLLLPHAARVQTTPGDCGLWQDHDPLAALDEAEAVIRAQLSR